MLIFKGSPVTDEEGVIQKEALNEIQEIFPLSNIFFV